MDCDTEERLINQAIRDRLTSKDPAKYTEALDAIRDFLMAYEREHRPLAMVMGIPVYEADFDAPEGFRAVIAKRFEEHRKARQLSEHFLR